MRFAELLATPGVEELCELRSTFGFMAFHGGNLERVTDVIASVAAERSGASLYAVVQPPPMREHLPSTQVSPDASPVLARFLDHAQLELSNNLAENSMRGVALGRKNWIHIGSEKAGPKVAAILSVVESCRRLGVPARAYLAAVLPGLSDLKIKDLAEKTPAAWVRGRR